MKKKNFFVWLVSAISVTLVTLMLVGCPHNPLLATAAQQESEGNRTSNGEVKLVVTNFTTEGNQSLLDKPRLIEPTHIDLTQQAEINKYVFVARGSSADKTYDPDFIDILAGSGLASLNILGGGVWDITVEAYDVEKLKDMPGITGETREAILSGDNRAKNLQAIVENGQVKASVKKAALVLAGSATVDLDSGASIRLTLTNNPVTEPGGVDIAIHFKSETDVGKIFTENSKWKVEAELIDSNQSTVMGTVEGQTQTQTTKLTLWDKTNGKDIDPKDGYTYNKYDEKTSTYEEVTIRTEAGKTKVLRYNPMKEDKPLQIPKGKYQLQVIVTDTENNETIYRRDPDFYVEGNRTTKGVAEITEVMGRKPAEVEGFGVSWTKPTTIDQKIGYDAVFAWTPKPAGDSAVGYEIELADITNLYTYADGEMKLNGTEFTDGKKLWEELEKLNGNTSLTRKTFSWDTKLETSTDIPSLVEGNLSANNTKITLRLETGHVYTARIRTQNGTSTANSSDWTIIGTGNVTYPSDFTQFVMPKTKGIFDLMKITYDLEKNDMWTLNDDRSASKKIDSASDSPLSGANLIQYEEYKPGIPTQLEYGFDGNSSTGRHMIGTNDKTRAQALTLKNQKDILTNWKGWREKNPTGTVQKFGPAKGGTPPTGNEWKKTDWTYDRFKDLDLEPDGVGGSSAGIVVETPGTFDVFDVAKNIGFSSGDDLPDGKNHGKLLKDLPHYKEAIKQGPGVYRSTDSKRLIIVHDRANNFSDKLKVHIAIGHVLDGVISNNVRDKNGNPISPKFEF